MATADYYDLVQQFYIGYYGRPADPEGLEYWAGQVDEAGGDFTGVLDAFATSPEADSFVYTNPVDDAAYTDEQLVINIYENLFGRDPSEDDQEGLDFYVDGLESGDFTLGSIVKNVIDGAQGNDETTLENKVIVAQYFTDNLGDKAYTEDDIVDARDVLADIDETGDSVSAGEEAADDLIAGLGEGDGDDNGDGDSDDFTLTNSQDTLTGTDGDDVFVAPLSQNDLGGVTNTLASGDMIDGQGGTDSLEAALISENTQVGGQSTVVEPITQSVENIFFQAQGQEVPLINYLEVEFNASTYNNQYEYHYDYYTGEVWQGNFGDDYNDQAITFDLGEMSQDLGLAGPITVDAGKMSGLEQLWSDNSRSDLQVEDVRERPEDMAIGMRGTDPWVSFDVDFDSNMFDKSATAADSSVTFQLVDQENPGEELANFPIRGVRFDYEGESYAITSDDMNEANSFDDFRAALEAALDDAGFGDFQIEQSAFTDTDGNEGVQYVITDPDGGTFAEPGVSFDQEELGGAGELFWFSQVGEPVAEDNPIYTNVVLDNVGRMDQGGVLDIGGMSNKGVEQFDVEVVSSSWLTSMQSTSRSVDPDTGSFNHLETVNISHADGGEGDLVLGSQVGAQTDYNPTDLPTGHRVATNGLRDVKTFNAEGFEGAINLGAVFTSEIYGRYLDDADETVQFEYLGGDGGNLFSIAFVDDTVAGDPDFALDVVGGSSDDRFNLVGDFDLENIALYGGEGEDTVEVQSSIGIDPDSTPAAFESIENLILAGNDVDANMVATPGVESLVIATDNGSDSTILNLDTAETTVTISGKNQTLTDSTADQSFGDIVFEETAGDSLTINIENTGRYDSELTIALLEVAPDTDGTAPEEVVLNSIASKDRDQVNTVRNFAGLASTDVLIEGDTDFNIHVSDLASAVGANDDDDPLTVDAQNADNEDVEALDGDLTLAMNGSLLTNGSDDVLTGAEGENDLLAFYDAMDTDATISDFETIQFGWQSGSELDDTFAATQWASGTFDAANTSDVGLYVVGSRNGDLTLTNLENGANVQIGDLTDTNGSSFSTGWDTTLEGTGSGALNVDIVANADISGGNQTDSNGFDLFVNDFATLNLDVARFEDTATGNLDTREVDLVLDNATGIDLDAETITTDDSAENFVTDAGTGLDALEVDNVVKNLNITGGEADEPDALDLAGGEDLPASMSNIDVSEYYGTFTAVLENAVIEDPDNEGQYISANTDTHFVLGAEEDADITLTALTAEDTDLTDPLVTGDATSVDFNTIFEFTGAPAQQTSAGDPAVTWTIDNFVAEGFDNATNDNYSILDLEDLGIETFADLDFTDTATGVEITEEGGASTWMIELVGVQEADLAPSENFDFA